MLHHRPAVGRSRGIPGVRACAALLIAVAGLIGTVPPAAADRPAPDRATAKFEIRFMQDMIDHHAMAVDMAEMCVMKAVHAELRAMCEEIIATQSQEIQQMQNWLEQWYGVSYQPQMKPGEMRMMERLASLSGAEFEVAFMQMMIRHHEQAIREAEQCLRRASHPELRTLCQNIIATQGAEIEQMQAWLCEWYDICRGGGRPRGTRPA